jgi:hypothetical protein
MTLSQKGEEALRLGGPSCEKDPIVNRRIAIRPLADQHLDEQY